MVYSSDSDDAQSETTAVNRPSLSEGKKGFSGGSGDEKAVAADGDTRDGAGIGHHGGNYATVGDGGDGKKRAKEGTELHRREVAAEEAAGAAVAAATDNPAASNALTENNLVNAREALEAGLGVRGSETARRDEMQRRVELRLVTPAKQGKAGTPRATAGAVVGRVAGGTGSVAAEFETPKNVAQKGRRHEAQYVGSGSSPDTRPPGQTRTPGGPQDTRSDHFHTEEAAPISEKVISQSKAKEAEEASEVGSVATDDISPRISPCKEQDENQVAAVAEEVISRWKSRRAADASEGAPDGTDVTSPCKAQEAEKREVAPDGTDVPSPYKAQEAEEREVAPVGTDTVNPCREQEEVQQAPPKTKEPSPDGQRRVLVEQFDLAPETYDDECAGIRLRVSEERVAKGKYGPVTILTDKRWIVEKGGASFLAATVVDFKPSGAAFSEPLVLEIDVEGEDECLVEKAAGVTEEDQDSIDSNLTEQDLQEQLTSLNHKYQFFERGEEGDAWRAHDDGAVVFDEKLGKYFFRANIKHFSQGCLGKKLNLQNNIQDERVRRGRPGKREWEFVNATDKSVMFLVLPTSYSASAISSLAFGLQVVEVGVDATVERQVVKAILPAATGVQAITIPPKEKPGNPEDGQIYPYRLCMVPEFAGRDARVLLVTVDNHEVSMFKAHDPGRTMPVKTNLPKLRQRALDAGDYYKLVTSVIPYESWSSAFHKAFYSLVYGKHTDWETWGKGHMLERSAQVEHRSGLLKKNHNLSEEHVRIIKSELPSKLAQFAKRSPDMQPFLETWEEKMAEVNVFVEQRKASADSSSSSSSSSESSSDDDSASEVRTCGVCKPSPDEGSKCKSCNTLHLQTCPVINKGPGTNLECKDYPDSDESDDEGGHATKRRRKGDKQTLPEDDSPEVDNSMRLSSLKTNNSPKLSMVDLTRNEFLFKRTPASKTLLKKFLGALLDASDEKGTIACAIPRPWYERGAQVHEAFRELSDADVENCPLVTSYTSVSGGARPKNKEGHMRNQQEHVLVVHRRAELQKEADVLAASFAVSQAMSKTSHLVLQVMKGDRSNPKLVLKRPKRSSSRSSRDISDLPVWAVSRTTAVKKPCQDTRNVPASCREREPCYSTWYASVRRRSSGRSGFESRSSTWPARQTNADLVDNLLKAGADGSAGWKGCNGQTLLHAAAEGGNEQVVSALVRAGAKEDMHTKAQSKGRTPLHLAAVGGHVAAAKVLVMAGADENVLDADREDTLHLAIIEGHAGVAEDLRLRGADPNVEGSNGDFPIHVAAFWRQDEIVRNLLHTGVNRMSDNERTALRIAVDRDNLSTVKILLDGGADVAALSDGATPLHRTVPVKNMDILAALMEAGADMELDAADLLFRWGANETALDKKGGTPRIPNIARASAQDRPILERLSKQLAYAPRGRAWRRRGLLVMCRAHPDRLRLAVEVPDIDVAIGQLQGRPSRRARRGEVKVEVTMGGALVGGAGGSRSSARGGGGRRAARGGSSGGGFDGMATWLMALREEDVFRKIVGFL
eukprot:g10830.t1